MAMGGDRGIFTTQDSRLVFLPWVFQANSKDNPWFYSYCMLPWLLKFRFFFLRGGFSQMYIVRCHVFGLMPFFCVCGGGWKRVGQRINFSEARPCLHQHKIPALSSASIWPSLGRISVDLGNLKFPKSGVFFWGCLVMCCENVFQIQDALSHLRCFCIYMASIPKNDTDAVSTHTN